MTGRILLGSWLIIEDMLPVASQDMLSERFLLSLNSEKIKLMQLIQIHLKEVMTQR